MPVPRPSKERVPVAAPSPAGERRYLALMSTLKKVGSWTPNRSTNIKAIMGEVRIDLREATFVDSEIEFHVFALMAETVIIVPPGVRVECDGLAVMGEFADEHDASANDPDGPLVRVHGSSIMARVAVETRMPGETRRAAKRRARLERDARGS
jgi:hypothetical protein